MSQNPEEGSRAVPGVRPPSASENLPPFSGNTTDCPKCGLSCAKVTWHSHGGTIGDHKGFPCEHHRLLAEHMCRTCRCGYGWLEATADAGASEPRRLRPAR
jgi:hypothetical protein